MLVAYEIGNYDDLYEQKAADHPDWNCYQIESYLKDLNNWEENFYQADITLDNLVPLGMVIKDI